MSIIDAVLRENNFRQLPDGVWERQVTSLRTLKSYRVRAWDLPEGSAHEARMEVLNDQGESLGTKEDTKAEVYSEAVAMAHGIGK